MLKQKKTILKRTRSARFAELDAICNDIIRIPEQTYWTTSIFAGPATRKFTQTPNGQGKKDTCHNAAAMVAKWEKRASLNKVIDQFKYQ